MVMKQTKLIFSGNEWCMFYGGEAGMPKRVMPK
jgi:hypothetical protein